MEAIKNLRVNMEQKILQSNNVIIVPHTGIDFDAIGSAIGLSLIAKRMKKESSIVVDDPFHQIDPGVQLVIEAAKTDFSIITRDKYLQTQNEEDLFVLTDERYDEKSCLKSLISFITFISVLESFSFISLLFCFLVKFIICRITITIKSPIIIYSILYLFHL